MHLWNTATLTRTISLAVQFNSNFLHSVHFSGAQKKCVPCICHSFSEKVLRRCQSKAMLYRLPWLRILCLCDRRSRDRFYSGPYQSSTSLSDFLRLLNGNKPTFFHRPSALDLQSCLQLVVALVNLLRPSGILGTKFDYIVIGGPQREPFGEEWKPQHSGTRGLTST